VTVLYTCIRPWNFTPLFLPCTLTSYFKKPLKGLFFLCCSSLKKHKEHIIFSLPHTYKYILLQKTTKASSTIKESHAPKMHLISTSHTQMQPTSTFENCTIHLQLLHFTSNFYTPIFQASFKTTFTFSFFKCHILNKTHIIECGPFTLPPPMYNKCFYIFEKLLGATMMAKHQKHLKLPKHAPSYQLVSFFFVGSHIMQCTTLNCIDFLQKPPLAWNRQHKCNILGHTCSASLWFHLSLKGLHAIMWGICKLYC